MEQLKSKKGITLIALVVTIIVLIILEGVSINLVLGDKGIITIAKRAKENIELTQIEEEKELNELYLKLETATGGSEAGTKETIPTQEDEVKTASGNAKGYVGYYADLNNDGKITLEDDGIIYADLAVGASGLWNDNEWSNYSYEAITSGLKQYYISSATTEVDPLKTGKGIIREVEGTSGTDRFYVMALEDFQKDGKKRFYWYNNAYEKLDDSTGYRVNDFGQGKTKTATEIGRWNSSYYGEQITTAAYIDMWGAIQTKVSEGWFVPSKGEWSAFGDFLYKDLGVTTSNYANLGISYWYWSSSQRSVYDGYYIYFDHATIQSEFVDEIMYVRLSTTF